MRLAVAVAALAVASLSLAFSPAFAAHDGSPSDPNGQARTSHQGRVATDLGVNITLAGNTPAEVQRFLAALAPDTRRMVLAGCRHYLMEPEQTKWAATIPFCKKAL
jgi:hypothetical protein